MLKWNSNSNQIDDEADEYFGSESFAIGDFLKSNSSLKKLKLGFSFSFFFGRYILT